MTDADLAELELRFASTLTEGGGLRAFARSVEAHVIAAERERIAREWDGCKCEVGNEIVDIGSIIRGAGRIWDSMKLGAPPSQAGK